MTQKKTTSKKASAKKRKPTKKVSGYDAIMACGVVAVLTVGGIALSKEVPANPEQLAATPAAASKPATTAKPTKSTPGQKAAQAAYDAGFRGETLVIMIAIADQESDFRSIDNAGLNKDGSVDYGVWQINKRQHPGLFRKYNWKSVGDNARMAKIVFDEKVNGKRRGFTPWASYNSGAYRQNLATARTLAAGVTK